MFILVLSVKVKKEKSEKLARRVDVKSKNAVPIAHPHPSVSWADNMPWRVVGPFVPFPRSDL